jgi:hypothetical protein
VILSAAIAGFADVDAITRFDYEAHRHICAKRCPCDLDGRGHQHGE